MGIEQVVPLEQISTIGVPTHTTSTVSTVPVLRNTPVDRRATPLYRVRNKRQTTSASVNGAKVEHRPGDGYEHNKWYS